MEMLGSPNFMQTHARMKEERRGYFDAVLDGLHHAGQPIPQ